MRDLFFFDIETRGAYKDFNMFKLNDPRGSELFEKKYQKYDWSSKYADVYEAYEENSCIFSSYGEICCISAGYYDTNGEKRISSIYGENEKDIVTKFNDMLRKISVKNFDLCGYRIIYFDIIWILHKLHKYDIIPADIIQIYDKKPWEMRLVDFSELWKQKFAYTATFDEVAYELGIDSPKSKMDGSEVHSYFWGGKVEDIKDYCEADVNCLMDVYKKIFI